jgi:tetrahydromethanopterin S-methyltransferase subunit A
MNKNGIEYIASENTYPFLENLNEEYIRSLTEKVNWVCNRFQDYSYQDIKNFVSDNKEKWGSEITYCTIGLIDE